MSLEHFMDKSLSSWMNEEGPQSDIVLSSRVRLARNLKDYYFFPKMDSREAEKVIGYLEEKLSELKEKKSFDFLKMADLNPLEKRVLVEKHVISPLLAEESLYGACWLTDDEKISIMINEEDHLRVQCILSGFQLVEALDVASEIDDFIEQRVDYAFDEKLGYLTSCPTNVGTGLRASVMVHVPGLVLTQQISRIIPAINQLGFVVRGMYGEGSAAYGNIFQISNQTTLGKSEKEIVEDLKTLVEQIIAQERMARDALLQSSNIQLEDRIFRSLGILKYARVMESKEAAQCLSDVRLGIDLGFIGDISKTILNELLILTQPGFLQLYSGEVLNPEERDLRRAAFIRKRVNMEINEE
ncbi:MAG: protein arginine kinase [Bacillus sp. (in: firmicutes)]